MPSGATDDDGEVDSCHSALRDDGAPGGAGDAEAGAVDQSRVEAGVGDEAADGDVQRGPGVLQTAQHPGGGEDDQHGRDAERGDAQIGGGVGSRGGGSAEEVHDARCQREDERDDRHAQQQCEPDAVHALTDGRREVARADAPGDGGRRGVGEEDEHAHGGGEKGRGDPETGELGGAEVADDGTVRHDEQGLRDECAEGRDGQRDDLSVVPAASGLGDRWSLCHGH